MGLPSVKPRLVRLFSIPASKAQSPAHLPVQAACVRNPAAFAQTSLALKLELFYAEEAKARQREAQSRGGKTPTGAGKITQKIEQSKNKQTAAARAAAAKTNCQYVLAEETSRT